MHLGELVVRYVLRRGRCCSVAVVGFGEEGLFEDGDGKRVRRCFVDAGRDDNDDGGSTCRWVRAEEL